MSEIAVGSLFRVVAGALAGVAVPSLRRLSGSFLLKRRCAAHCRPALFLSDREDVPQMDSVQA